MMSDSQQNRRPWGGRTVMITGASRGIGRATAVLFSRLGAKVVAHGRDVQELFTLREQAISEGGDVTTVVADLRDATACERVVADCVSAVGELHVLVNNAGANAFHGVLGASLKEWDDCLAI